MKYRDLCYCDKCQIEGRKPTTENEYGEFVCESCEQNENERAWERHCENFYG